MRGHRIPDRTVSMTNIRTSHTWEAIDKPTFLDFYSVQFIRRGQHKNNLLTRTPCWPSWGSKEVTMEGVSTPINIDITHRYFPKSISRFNRKSTHHRANAYISSHLPLISSSSRRLASQDYNSMGFTERPLADYGPSAPRTWIQIDHLNFEPTCNDTIVFALSKTPEEGRNVKKYKLYLCQKR